MIKCNACWGSGKALDHKRLGVNAHTRRLARGLSLKVVAASLGISESHLCLLEKGRRRWTEAWYDVVMGL